MPTVDLNNYILKIKKVQYKICRHFQRKFLFDVLSETAIVGMDHYFPQKSYRLITYSFSIILLTH